MPRYRTSSFRGTHLGKLSGVLAYDVTGKPTYSASRGVRFSPIRLNISSKETSVRTDVAGSHGQAEQKQFDGRVLLEPRSDVKLKDVFEFRGELYVVDSIDQKYDQGGLLDHYQVDLAYG